MGPNDAVRAMLDGAGLSPYAASIKMGKAHSYVLSAIKRKGGISAAVVSEIAQACNYSLQLVPQDGAGDPIVIDGSPPAD